MTVALEGPDGAGKSTQVARLADWARDRGLECRTISKWDLLADGSYPVARFLRGTSREELRACVPEMPSPARAFFLMWLISCAATIDVPDGTDLVVLDGYWMKHAAAELAYGCDPGLVEALRESMPPVDAVVYLDVTPEVALVRKNGNLTPYECGRDPGCDPKQFLTHQRALRRLLHGWAVARGWHVVDTTDPDAAQEAIRQIVSGLAGSGGVSSSRP